MNQVRQLKHGEARKSPADIVIPVKISVSVVVPVYNEEENVLPLCRKLIETLNELSCGFEIIFIDDGSRDKSFERLETVASEDSRVKAIKFKRNFGQTAALSAGFNEARGDIIIPIDADLQNSPRDIPRLIAKLSEGFYVVSGWRKNRKDGLIMRKLPSVIANKIIAFITGVAIHDYGCTLKAYRRTVLEDVRLYGEMHRFIPAYAAWNGGRVAEIEVEHNPRAHGTSKYGISRTLRVILDMIVVKFLMSYFPRPIHFFGGFGILALFAGGASGTAAIILKIWYGVPFIITPLPLLTAFLVILGVQFILMGLLAEILMRVYYETQDKPTYSVVKRINF